MNKFLNGLQVGDILVDISECPVSGERNGTIDVVMEITQFGDINGVFDSDFQENQWLRFATMEDIQNSDRSWMTTFVFKRENSSALAFNFESLFLIAEKKLS